MGTVAFHVTYELFPAEHQFLDAEAVMYGGAGGDESAGETGGNRILVETGGSAGCGPPVADSGP